MDKAQALHLFWSSFGLTAIDENSDYDSKARDIFRDKNRYITYEVGESNFLGPQTLTANLWFRETSWAAIEAKAKAIAAFIGYGGKTFAIEGGFLRIMLPLNTTIYRRMPAEDNTWRRILITVAVDFLTAT